MSRPLPRFTKQHLDDERKLARILLDTGATAPQPPPTATRATLPGDRRKLRGIPVAGGACGTSPGTDPYHATATKLDNIRHVRHTPPGASVPS